MDPFDMGPMDTSQFMDFGPEPFTPMDMSDTISTIPEPPPSIDFGDMFTPIEPPWMGEMNEGVSTWIDPSPSIDLGGDMFTPIEPPWMSEMNEGISTWTEPPEPFGNGLDLGASGLSGDVGIDLAAPPEMPTLAGTPDNGSAFGKSSLSEDVDVDLPAASEAPVAEGGPEDGFALPVSLLPDDADVKLPAVSEASVPEGGAEELFAQGESRLLDETGEDSAAVPGPDLGLGEARRMAIQGPQADPEDVSLSASMRKCLADAPRDQSLSPSEACKIAMQGPLTSDIGSLEFENRAVDALRDTVDTWGDWSELKEDQRLAAMQQVENVMADLVGRLPATLQVYDSPKTAGSDGKRQETGSWDPKTNCILISRDYLKNGSLHHVIDTTLHEGRHAYQEHVIDPDLKWMHPDPDAVAAWEQNLRPATNYLHEKEYGEQLYRRQPSELDAALFSSRIARRVCGQGK